jgi:hypothetical protein
LDFHAQAWGDKKLHEKVVLAGGTAFPGCARLTCFLGTGWKACATDLKNFSGQKSKDNADGGQCPPYIFP